MLAFWGGFVGLLSGGVAWPRKQWHATDRKIAQAGAIVKLMPALASSEFEAAKLVEAAAARWGWKEKDVSALVKGNADGRYDGAWTRFWAAIVEELYLEYAMGTHPTTP